MNLLHRIVRKIRKSEYHDIQELRQRGIHIGVNMVIMPGVTIGDNCIIGCGAVVTKDIPSGEIWGGRPDF